MKFLTHLAMILVIIGGLNWGLVGIANFNVISWLLERLYLDRIVYWLIGFSAVWMIFAYPMIIKKAMAKR